jgi:hypothetical protein
MRQRGKKNHVVNVLCGAPGLLSHRCYWLTFWPVIIGRQPNVLLYAHEVLILSAKRSSQRYMEHNRKAPGVFSSLRRGFRGAPVCPACRPARSRTGRVGADAVRGAARGRSGGRWRAAAGERGRILTPAARRLWARGRHAAGGGTPEASWGAAGLLGGGRPAAGRPGDGHGLVRAVAIGHGPPRKGERTPQGTSYDQGAERCGPPGNRRRGAGL